MQVPALFDLSYFAFDLHTGYDGMHCIGGTIQDTFLKCFQSRRFKAAVQAYEEAINRFIDTCPWEASSEDIASFTAALVEVVEATDSRMTGKCFTALMSPSRKNKTHSSFVLASPYGKQSQLHGYSGTPGTATTLHGFVRA